MRRKPGVMADWFLLQKNRVLVVGFGVCHGVASESDLCSDDGESDEFEHVKGL